MPKKQKLPRAPIGYRIVTPADKRSVEGLSGYLSDSIRPKLLKTAIRYYEDEKEWQKDEGHGYRFFHDDLIYAVPKDVKAITPEEHTNIQRVDRGISE
jgi:hypothetical protein